MPRERKMQVSFDVNLQPKDLFRFYMYQSYTTKQGPISIILFLVMIVIAVINFRAQQVATGILYIALGILFAAYIPFALWRKSHSILKTNKVLADTLHYQVSDAGIKVSQADDEGLLEWNLVYKIVGGKNQVLIYSNRINAYVIPREQLGENYEAFREIAQKNLEKCRFRLK